MCKISGTRTVYISRIYPYLQSVNLEMLISVYPGIGMKEHYISISIQLKEKVLLGIEIRRNRVCDI